jgi:hypothetical protein
MFPARRVPLPCRLLTFGRRLRVGMNKLISTGNERVIEVSEFIASSRAEGGLVHKLLSILASFREHRPVDEGAAGP